jgi:hypothetical protein
MRPAAASTQLAEPFDHFVFSLLIFLTAVPAAQPQPAARAGKPASTDSQLLALAETRVFKFLVETADGVRQGSGILIDIEKPRGKPDMGTFATAYHVLQGVTKVTVVDFKGNMLAESAKESPATAYAARYCELAFVRLELKPANNVNFQLTPLLPRVESPAGKPDIREKPTGVAFGYSREGAIRLDYSRIEFLGPIAAVRLPGLIDESVPVNVLDPAPSDLNLWLLTDQATLEGMSGGLVVDRQERFGGLVFGRRPDKYNLIVPADEVEATWDQAKLSRAAWKPLDSGSFTDRSYFGSGQGSFDHVDVDRIDWGTIDSLTVLLGADPSQAIGQFQEIVVTPPKTGLQAPELELFVDENETLPDDKHGLEFSLDGRKLPWTRSARATGPNPLKIPLEGKPGERLLIVAKESGRVNDFELGGLFVPSKIDVTFRQEGKPFRRVVRSLPRIVQKYPIFVTIRNGSPLAAMTPVPARPAAAREVAAPAERPANARIAVRLDFAEAVLRRAPLLLRMRHGPDGKGSEFKGFFTMDREKGWDVNRVSPQRLGLVMRGQVRIQRARYQSFGLTIQRNDNAEPFPLQVRGRLQFPPDLGEFFLSARASGTAGDEPFRIELGKELSLDAAGFLRYVFTCYVNNQLLLPINPKAPEHDKIKGFIADVGLKPAQGWSLDPRQVLLVPAEDGFSWVVATVRLDRTPKKEAGGKLAEPPRPIQAVELRPAPNTTESDLLRPPVSPAGVFFDVSALDIPGVVVAQFPGLAQVNPVVAEVLSPSTIGDFQLSSSLLAGTSLGGAADKIDAIPVQDDDGKKLAERIRAVFTESVVGGSTVLDVTVGHDLARRALERAIARPGLNLQSVGQGVLHIRAGSRPGASEAKLNIERGTCTFATPRNQVIDLGDGASLNDARLVVSQLDAEGRADQDRVKAKLAALAEVGSLKFGAVEFQALSGGITGVVDTGGPELAEFTLNIQKGRATIMGRGFITLKPIDNVRVTVSRAGVFHFDKAQLMEILIKQLLGVP